MVTNLTLTKGAFSVEIHTVQIEDGFTNKVFKITPGTGKQTQAAGPKENKVIDLLRITRTFRLMGHLLNNAEKKNLVKIIEGAETDGGGITFTYSDGGDASSYNTFVESCIITQGASDYGIGWLSGESYKAGGVVEYLGTFYNVIQDIGTSTTIPPSDTSNFTATNTNDFAKFDVNMTLIKGIS